MIHHHTSMQIVGFEPGHAWTDLRGRSHVALNFRGSATDLTFDSPDECLRLADVAQQCAAMLRSEQLRHERAAS